MKWPVTFCPVCGAEHTDEEKLSEREAVELCLGFELTKESRDKHMAQLDQVRQD